MAIRRRNGQDDLVIHSDRGVQFTSWAYRRCGDVMFGAEITLQTTNLPPAALPKLAFNEIPSVTNTVFWVEILNYGNATESMGGMVLARYGNNNTNEYVIPAQTVPPEEQ